MDETTRQEFRQLAEERDAAKAVSAAVSERIKEKVRERPGTGPEMADALGISRQAINKILKGSG